MLTHFDSDSATWLRLACSFVLVGLAARLSFSWAHQAGGPLAGRLGAAAGAGASLAAGLCAAAALSALIDPVAGVGLPWRWPTAALAVGAAFLAALVTLAAERLHGRAAPALPGVWWLASGLVSMAMVVTQELARLGDPSAANDAPSAIWMMRLQGGLALAVAGVAMLFLLALQQRHERAAALRLRAQRAHGAQALTDPLTRLPGRVLFEGTLTQAAAQADAAGQRLALFHIGIDDFGLVNQGYGQDEGDRMLRKLASRLRGLAQPHRLARLGGDEFLMLLGDDPSADDAATQAAELLAELARPCALRGRQVTVTASIGLALYPEHGARGSLLVHAAVAMRAAKAAGGATYAFFDPSMGQGAREQAELLKELRAAVAGRQLELFYQPKVHAPSGQITGAEALLRWNHPRRGMISPAVFLPLAEKHGLINALGAWVIDEACRQARAWRDGGLRMRVAINLSTLQLRQSSLTEQIGSALQRHGVKPDLLTCEITETTAMDDTEVTDRVMAQMHALGVNVSIDDFGTGHSSLAYLRKLSAHELKIDRSFVLDLESSEDARKVACAVINLAKALNIKVVAEGVETEGQYQLLREYGCDELQGFLFARPMSASALAKWALDEEGPRSMQFRASLFRGTRQFAAA